MFRICTEIVLNVYCVIVSLPNAGRPRNVMCCVHASRAQTRHVPGRRTRACAWCPASSLSTSQAAVARWHQCCISSSCAEAGERSDLAVPALNSFYSGFKSNWSPPPVSCCRRGGCTHPASASRHSFSAASERAGLAGGFGVKYC